MNTGTNVSKETIDLFKSALGAGTDAFGQPLRKDISLSTGLVYYDLQAPAKNLYPTITPIRNSLPRVHRPHSGGASNWKQITSLVGSGWDSMGWVPEGQRSGRMNYVTANKSATYVTLGEEDSLTFEAESAAQGFEDENAMLSMRLMQKTMRKEEIGLLAGNATLALGTPGTPTVSASGSGATLPTATYYVRVVALTLEGFKNSSIAGGVATTKTITGADGNTFVLNGGSSNKSAEVNQGITLGQTLFASIPVVTGAVGYAWFVGTASNTEYLQAITPINSCTFSAPISTSTQAIAAITADSSTNPNYAYDGLLTQALNPANLAYVNTLATGVAGTGTVLTSSGRGSCNEIDLMMQKMWDNYNLGPTVLWVNSQQQKDITTKCLTSTSGPLLKYEVPTTPGQAYGIVAGGVIDFYFNPYTGQKIPVKVHPDVTPGTILGWCEKLPEWYQSNEVPNVAEILCRRDYYRMDWPLRTRKREYGVYAEQVLAIYATFAMGVINNVAAG